MFVVIFDESGEESLSGWHYEKLHEFNPEWIQQSVIKLDSMKTAMELAKRLLKFGVDDVKIFKANDLTGKLEDYVYT